jgi:hypothetical protein
MMLVKGSSAMYVPKPSVVVMLGSMQELGCATYTESFLPDCAGLTFVYLLYYLGLRNWGHRIRLVISISVI